MLDTNSTAAHRWAAQLAEWAIPDEIRAQAPREPWGFDPAIFRAPPSGGSGTRARSTALAAEVIPDGGVVLDVGCGGGAAAFALVPPATALIGTDQQPDMVELFAATAAERGIPAQVFAGAWPDVGDEVPVADVVVSNNVLYNVPDLMPFVRGLHDHARRRVVIEITRLHPLASRNALWKHFWGIERPTEPTAALAAEVVRDAGLPVTLEYAEGVARGPDRTTAEHAAMACRQLCLPLDRADEVAEQLALISFPTDRAVLWWDV